MFSQSRTLTLGLSSLVLCASAHGLQSPTLLKDINPGSADSNPETFIELNGKLFFIANNGVHGAEPWICDGTDSGTHMLLDVNPGNQGSIPFGPYSPTVIFQGKAYFSAFNAQSGLELWCTDGTTAGTNMVFDFEPGAGSSDPVAQEFAGQLLVTADTSGLGREFWISDGTVAGTQLLMDINSGPSSGVHRSVFGIDGSTLYFAGDDGLHGVEPWSWDSSAGPPAMIVELRPGLSDGAGISGVVWGGEWYFQGRNSVSGWELFATDGSALGTRLVADIDPGPNSGRPILSQGVGALASGFLFTAETAASGKQPWFTDGTAAGTHDLGDFSPGVTQSSNPYYVLSPTRAAFMGHTAATGLEPVVTDGTLAGTHVVDLRAGPGSGLFGILATQLGDRLFFWGAEVLGDARMGVTDGTVLGTMLLPDLVSGQVSGLGEILAAGDAVYFSTTGLVGYSNGAAATTQVLPAHTSGARLTEVDSAIRIGDLIYLAALDDALPTPHGTELWVMAADLDGDGVETLFDDLNAQASCFCDMAVAPCANADPAAGCAQASGAIGALLSAAGSTRLTNDDLQLITTQLPANQFAVLFSAPDLNAPLPFGNGLRCAGGGLLRWGVQASGATGSLTYGPGLAAQAQGSFAPQFHLQPGRSYHFQTWFRDPGGPCGSSSNVSNAMSVVFTP